MTLINCEVNLILDWSEDCVIICTDVANQNTTFAKTETMLHVPVVTLSTQDNAKLLAQLKPGFIRTMNWNKYTPKLELLAQNLSFNYLVEQSFQGLNRLLVLAFKNDAEITSNKIYYLPIVKIKNYNIMIDGKDFFDQPIKIDKITYNENIRQIAASHGNDYSAGFLLDYTYFKNIYKVIAIDLNKHCLLKSTTSLGILI